LGRASFAKAERTQMHVGGILGQSWFPHRDQCDCGLNAPRVGGFLAPRIGCSNSRWKTQARPEGGAVSVAYGMAPQPHGSRAYAGKKKSFIRPRFAALATSALNRERRFEARAKTEERRTKRGSLAKCRASLFVFSPTLLASLVVCRLPSGGLWLSSLLHTVVID
jgi:hypothetical protein